MQFPISAPLEPSPYLQVFSIYLAPIISGSRHWPFGVTWRTSLVMWPFDAPYRVSYWRSIVTDSLSPAVFEILGPKHIGVTTLTFQGHVTSSITWRFDSPYRVSYWCSIGTKSISPRFFEIFGSKVPVQCKSSLRMRDIAWPVPPMQNLGTYLNFPPHIDYSLWHFYWAPMKIKGCLLVKPPMLNAKSSESPYQNWANLGSFGGLGSGVSKSCDFYPQKARPCVKPRRLSHFASKLVEGCDLQVSWGKKVRKSQRLP